MVFNCEKGMFILERNYRDAFKLEDFISKYLEEYFNKYEYIVGDISSQILRLKGFDTNPKSKNYYKFIDSYLDTSCALGCPFYVLKRIHTEEEYKILEESFVSQEETPRIVVKDMPKENFDKESLNLISNQGQNPHIVIDSYKMNEIKIGKLPQELKEDIKDNSNKNKNVKKPEEEKKQENVEMYVSSSPDFDPSKKKKPNKHNMNNNRPNNKGNQNNKNFKKYNGSKEV